MPKVEAVNRIAGEGASMPVLFDESSQGTIAQIAETIFDKFLADQGWDVLKQEFRDMVYAPAPEKTEDFIHAIRIKTFQSTYQWELHWAKTYGWYFHSSHWWSVHHPDSLETLYEWTLKPNAVHLFYNFGFVHPTLETPITLKPSLQKLFQKISPDDNLYFRSRWPHPLALRELKEICPNLIVVNLRDLDRFETKYEQKVKHWTERRKQHCDGDPDVFSLEPDGTFRPDIFDLAASREKPSWVYRDHLDEYLNLYKPGMQFLEEQKSSPDQFYFNFPISNGGKLKYRDEGIVLDWPDPNQIYEAARFILEKAADGKIVLFHCRGGRHRTGMIALLLEKLSLIVSGLDSEEATHQLKQKYAGHVTGLDGHVTGFRAANLSAVNQLLKDPNYLTPLIELWKGTLESKRKPELINSNKAG